MLDPAIAAIAANRFGLGARPAELAAIGADGREWLRAQLKGAPPVLAGAQLRPSAEILAQGLRLRHELEEAKRSGGVQNQDLERLGQYLKPIYTTEVIARCQQAATTERPFVERLLSQTFPLARSGDAFQAHRSPDSIKVAVIP